MVELCIRKAGRLRYADRQDEESFAMSVVLNLPSDLESKARALASARGEDVETFLVRQIAVTLKAQAEPRAVPSKRSLNETLMDRLNRWTALHPVVGFVDDSRESFYAGRE